MDVRRDSGGRVVRRACAFAAAASFALASATALAARSELSDTPIPMATEKTLPQRTAPLIEIGPKFLGTGNLPQGIELPTGAVWNPSFWVYGSYRTALDRYDNGIDDPVSEWANRLDLFGNLHLSGTERVLIGVSPLSQDGRFSGYTWKPDSAQEWNHEFNTKVTRLFFEGNIDEIFPHLDPNATGNYDIGFAVGRQPLFFQEGLMINDSQVDGLGVTRDTIMIPGLSVDTRITGFWAWNDVNRSNNVVDSNAELLGLFLEGDWGPSTVDIDAAYVDSTADQFNFGIASTQRVDVFGRRINTSVRVDTSTPIGGETPINRDGTVLFGQFSTTVRGSGDIVYLDAFYAANEFRSAMRGETAGGPLGQTGILFSSAGLGRYGSALSSQADNVTGAAIGRQFFWNDERTQLILEVGGRSGTRNTTKDQTAAGARFQQALGRRFIFRVDGFVSRQQ
ncbi:MAG TPA: hypothetical protein VKA32_06020, partial [Gammaproteobacteria bacterium]|nr:hypothetical protein [Gammaproteobacteria bacterium]